MRTQFVTVDSNGNRRTLTDEEVNQIVARSGEPVPGTRPAQRPPEGLRYRSDDVSERQLTPEERSVCKALGISEEKFIANKAAERTEEGTWVELTPEERAVCLRLNISAEKFLANKRGDAAENQLTPEELAVCRALGIAPKAFLHNKRSPL